MDQKIIKFFEIYLKTTKGLKALTIKNYRADLRHFLSWLPLKLENLTPNHLEDYKKYLLTNKMAKSTINRKLATVRSFCQFCTNKGLLKQNPAHNLTNSPFLRSEDKKIHDLVSKFGSFLKKNRASRNTIKNYTADVRQYLLFQFKIQSEKLKVELKI